MPFPNFVLWFPVLLSEELFRIHPGFLSTRTDVPEVKLFHVEVLLFFVYNWLFSYMLNVPMIFSVISFLY